MMTITCGICGNKQEMRNGLRPDELTILFDENTIQCLKCQRNYVGWESGVLRELPVHPLELGLSKQERYSGDAGMD